MKKLKIWFLSVVTIFFVTGCFPGIGRAAEIERFELDMSTPTSFNRASLNMAKDFHNWTLNSDIRVSLVETRLGKLGVEGAPSYDFNSTVIHSSAGVFYAPVKWLQIHADHVNDVDVNHISGASWKGNDIVGVRLVIR